MGRGMIDRPSIANANVIQLIGQIFFGVTVVIDEMSWEYLAGSEIAYKTELIGAYFSIENPNAASTCGCGTSFSI